MTKENQTGEITALIERWMLLEKQGLNITVDDLCRDTPHLVDSVKQEIRAIQNMNRLQDKIESETSLGARDETSNHQLGRRTGTSQVTGSYQLKELLGHGGCSEVYVAVDEKLGRQVAVKFLRPDTQNIESFRDRLNREAEVTSRLNHPGVVSIYSTGQDENGLPFYVMRLVDGEPLSQAINDFHQSGSANGTTPRLESQQRKLLNHFIDVCQTIAFSHQHHVIHRDVKPANIIIGNFGETYLIDWGLAKMIDADDEPESSSLREHHDQNLTNVGQSIGTPAFMSPEQASGDVEIGFASDVFSLGATLYAILVGQPPYASDSAIENVKNALAANFDSPLNRQPNTAKPLAAICLKAMARRPADRYRTAAELAEDVERYLADQPVSAMPEPVSEKIRRWVTRNRTLVTAAGAAVAVGILLLVVGNTLLLNMNRRLAKSEADAVRFQKRTQAALDETTRSLYAKRIALAHSDVLDNNILRAKSTLASCAVENRQWEWGLLNWMTNRHQPVAQLTMRNQLMHSIALSNDQKLLAAGSADGLVRIWEIGTWNLKNEFYVRMEIKQLEFSPDGKFLTLVGQRGRGVVAIWDLAGTRIAQRTRNSPSMTDVEYTADGSQVVTCEQGGSLRIRNTKDLVPTAKSSRAHDDHINAVAIEPESSTFFTACADGTIGQWDMQCQRLTTTRTHTGGVLRLMVSDNHLISSGADNTVQIWQLQRQSDAEPKIRLRLQKQLVGHKDQVLALAVSPDKKYLATGGLDRNIVLWDLERGEPIAKIRFHLSHIRSLKFGAAGQYLYSAGDDRKVYVWSVAQLVQSRPRGKFVSYCGDNDQLIVASDREVLIWDTQQDKAVVRITDHPSQIIGLVSNRNDMFATLYRSGLVRVWNAHHGKMICEFDGKKYGPAYDACFFEPTKIAIGHHKQTFTIGNLKTGKIETTVDCEGVAFRVGLAQDRQTLIVLARDGKVSFWNTATVKKVGGFDTQHGSGLGLAMHPLKKQFATSGSDGLIKVWDFDSSEPRLTLTSGNSWINGIKFTTDGKRILAGTEHTVAIWDSEDGQEILSFSIDRCVHYFSFNKTGRKLALGGDTRDGASQNVAPPRIRIFESVPD